jgi:glycerate kinase
MKIVIATDSFKGTLSSSQAGRAIANGVRRGLPQAELAVLPVADGGEGSVEAILQARGGRRESAQVNGPLGGAVDATFGILPDGNVAVIEMAAASGLTLLEPAQYNPLIASTYGTGQLIAAALDHGCRELLIAVGGSATVDGGCGAAQALGVRLMTANGTPMEKRVGGGQLDRIDRIDLDGRDPRIAACAITVLCDVTNPLCGPNGAATVFGPQKGASAPQVEQLDRGLAHLADLIRRDLDIDVRDLPGAGAAGGLAAGLMAFVGAKLARGAETVLDLAGIDAHLAGADLAITGEGRLDAQSIMGKVVSGVAARARSAGVPVIAIAGSASPDADKCLQVLDAYYAVSDSPPSALTTSEASHQLTDCAAAVIAECVRGGLGSAGWRLPR